jgi:pyruvate dehydrogenase E2 component (dihydrolipoamide acetyltransferase)
VPEDELVEVDLRARMDAAIGLRDQFKELPGDELVPSFNDLIAPPLWPCERIREPMALTRRAPSSLHDRVNVGIAVAADGALVVPTIFDADGRSLGEIGS